MNEKLYNQAVENTPLSDKPVFGYSYDSKGKASLESIGFEQYKDPKAIESEYNRLAKERSDRQKQVQDGLQTAINNVGGNVQRSSGLSGNNGYLGAQRPYLIINIPNLNLPDNYGHYYGYPCNMTVNLGTLSGFTVVSDCHLDGFSCTKTELDEIEQLLKGGVIL